MNLKNYTSTVPMINSIQRIEHRLAQVGALHITKSYPQDGSGKPIGMTFQIEVNGIPITFKLPAEVESTFNYMVKQKSKPPTKSQMENLKAQADRTAWKILSDWVDIQISMIELGKRDFIQTFLAESYDLNTGKTFYEKIKESNFQKLLQ